MNDLMFKATDKAAWDAFAAEKNLTEDGAPLGCLIDEIGPIVTTPAVIGTDGEIVTPAIVDDHHHVNIRLTSLDHDPAVLADGGAGVEWVNPADVETPARIWAGGMNYWVPEA